MMYVFAVKHNGTGELLPVSFSTGGSWWEGESGGVIPRLFATRQGANAFISQWARGAVRRQRASPSNFFDEEHEDTLVIEDRGRRRTDLSIVTMKLELA